MTICRSSWATVLAASAALGVAAPVLASAQDANDHRHVVKRGDTLWDLARTYTGSPYQWPDVYKANSRTIGDPHWIYPGQAILIPGAAPDATATGPAQPDTGEHGSGRRDQAAPRTVFDRRPVHSAFGRDRAPGVIGRETAPTILPGEFVAAPYADRNGGPGGAGEILDPVALPGIAAGSATERLQMNERLYVRAPHGATTRAGDQYLAYRLADGLDNGAQVVIPTGIVTVERAGANEVTTVRLTQMFDRVAVGQGLLPVERFDATTTRPLPVTSGTPTKVVWIKDNPVLPSLQRYVVLAATSRDGVRQGDQFTLVRPRTNTDNGTLAEEPIAVAKIVRATAYGSTALIIGQSQPAVKLGVAAHLSAKMP